MTDLRKAAEMALEALEQTPTVNKLFDSESYEKQKNAIDALRQALAQPPCQIGSQCIGGKCPECEREWVGLTIAEVLELIPSTEWRADLTLLFAKAIEDILKEKNT